MQLSRGRAASCPIDEDRHRHEQKKVQQHDDDDEEDESFFSAEDSDGRLSEQESGLEYIRPSDVKRRAKDGGRSNNCVNEDSDIIAPSGSVDSFVGRVVVHEATINRSGRTRTIVPRASREMPAIPIGLANGNDSKTYCGSSSPSGTVDVGHGDDARGTRRGGRQRGGCTGIDSRSRSRSTNGEADTAAVAGDGRVFIACFAAISVSDLKQFEVRLLTFT